MTSNGVNVDSLLAAYSAAPGLDPSSLYGIAQAQPDPSIAAENAQGTQAFASSLTQANVLRRQDKDTQRRYWSRLTSDEQKLLSAAGYRPPKAEHHGGNWFSGAVGAVGGVVGGALKAGVDDIATGIGNTLHTAGAPLRAVQHAYRTGIMMDEEAKLRGKMGLPQLIDPHTWSPSDWAKAWRDSEHGEQTFLPSQVAKLRNQYGDEQVHLAKQVAGGKSLEDLIAATPESERQALATNISSKDFRDLVAQLNTSKISFGRRVVGTELFQSHPALASKLSGAIDGAADVYADPLMWGGKLAKAATTLPYLASDAARVGEILDKPNAARLLSEASAALNEGGAGALIRRFPRFAPVAQHLVDDGVTNAAEIKEWFQSEAGLRAIFEGKVGGFAPKGLDGAVVPNISRLGLAENTLKESTRKLIEFGADKGVPGFKTAHGLAHLVVPAGARIEAESPDGLRNLQRLADYALPSNVADDYVSAFAAAKDQGQRFRLYRGMLGEIFDRMGIPETYRAQFFDTLDDAHLTRSYGINDRMLIDGQTQPVGYLVSHVADHGWTVPDFRALQANADRSRVMGALYGTMNADLVTRFMNKWKPAQLLRMGFPIRVGGEEAVGQALREGPLSVLRGRAAASASDDAGLVNRIVARFSSHLPDDVAEKVTNPAEFSGAVLGDRTQRAMAKVKGALGLERYRQAAQDLAELVPGGLPEEISAAHAGGAGMLADAPTMTKLARNGAEMRPAVLAPDPGGAFTDYTPVENLYTSMWKAQLDEHANDPLAKIAAQHFDDGREAQVQAVVNRLNQDDMKFVRSRALRSSLLADGRAVGDTATADEALRDWAAVIVDNTNHLTSDAAGHPFTNLRDAVVNGHDINIDDLNSIPADLRPASVSGKVMVPVYGNGWWAEVQRRGFAHIGESINWISREPMFVHAYADAMQDVAPMRQALLDLGQSEEAAAQAVRETAFQRALNATTPYIHDPAVRSQFAEKVRNLAPFWFAQEQFYKRWAMTLSHTPQAFREAQLGMMGLRHAGFVHTDPQTGEDYFMYPGGNFAQSALSKAASLVIGHDITLPISAGMSGQVKFVSPGTERLGIPSFGPVVSIPMHALASRFPELKELEEATLGERGAGRPYWEQVTPSSVARVVHVLVDNPETSPQMHSAMLQAVQYMEASGHGLPDDATPAEQEKYLDRIKSWTRVLMLTRAIYGFSVPAAPDLELDPTHLHDEFRALLAKYPIDEATQRFLKAHPDATPYTVFQSKSVSGAPLPATAQAASFMEKHGDFLSAYPEAGAWFLPQTPGDGFSMPAYREQLALGLRQRKSLTDFYGDIKFAEAATDYFDTRDGKDQRLAAARARGDRTTVALINQQWSQWSAGYLKAHPLFAEQLLSPEGEIRRNRALDQIHQALSDDRLPATPQNDAIRDLVDTFDGWKARDGQLAGRRDQIANTTRTALKDEFISWAHNYVQAHPEVEGLYNSVFRLMVGDDTTVSQAA